MGKRSIHRPRKQRTRAHVLADLSANHVEKVALSCGFAVDRVWQDYGLDLAVFTFDGRGYLESGVIWMQLKATDKLKKTGDGKAVLVRIERRDILAWIGEVYPVVLVVYDATNDRAFWLWIESSFAFGKLRGELVTVSIPASNVMTTEVMRAFAARKFEMLAPLREGS